MKEILTCSTKMRLRLQQKPAPTFPTPTGGAQPTQKRIPAIASVGPNLVGSCSTRGLPPSSKLRRKSSAPMALRLEQWREAQPAQTGSLIYVLRSRSSLQGTPPPGIRIKGTKSVPERKPKDANTLLYPCLVVDALHATTPKVFQKKAGVSQNGLLLDGVATGKTKCNNRRLLGAVQGTLRFCRRPHLCFDQITWRSKTKNEGWG